jgi:hypothetical protein
VTAINCRACGASTFVGVTESGCPLRVDWEPAAGGDLECSTDFGRPVFRIDIPEELAEDGGPRWSAHLERLTSGHQPVTNHGYPVVRVFSADEAAGRVDLHWAHHLSCTAPVKPSSVEDIQAFGRASDNNPKENDRG